MPQLVKQRPLRVFMTADCVGGVWTYCLDLARGLSARGVETVIALFGPPTTRIHRREANAIPLLELIETGLDLDWTAASPLECQRAGERAAGLASFPTADVVQVNGAALALPAFTQIPSIVVHHSCLATWWRAAGRGDMPEDFRWRIAVNEEALRRATRVVAPTRAMACEIADAYNLDSMPLVIRNGRARTGLTRSDDLADAVFTAGRLWDEAKDIATLDRAAARLNIPVFAAGSTLGPMGQSITLHHLEELGPISTDDMRQWLSRRPIYVSSAIYEPFGLGVLEAAQAGCALVLVDTPTLRELWEGCAIFTPPGDDAAIAEAVEMLRMRPDQRELLGARAAERSSAYSLDSMVDRMLALYLQVAPEPADLIGQGAF